MSKKSNVFHHLRGFRVLHGEEGREKPDMISSILMAYGDKEITVEFFSGQSTNIPTSKFNVFLEEGSVFYSREGYEGRWHIVDESVVGEMV